MTNFLQLSVFHCVLSLKILPILKSILSDQNEVSSTSLTNAISDLIVLSTGQAQQQANNDYAGIYQDYVFECGYLNI